MKEDTLRYNKTPPGYYQVNTHETSYGGLINAPPVTRVNI